MTKPLNQMQLAAGMKARAAAARATQEMVDASRRQSSPAARLYPNLKATSVETKGKAEEGRGCVSPLGGKVW